jgi:hypothetical protein
MICQRNLKWAGIEREPEGRLRLKWRITQHSFLCYLLPTPLTTTSTTWCHEFLSPTTIPADKSTPTTSGAQFFGFASQTTPTCSLVFHSLPAQWWCQSHLQEFPPPFPQTNFHLQLMSSVGRLIFNSIGWNACFHLHTWGPPPVTLIRATTSVQVVHMILVMEYDLKGLEMRPTAQAIQFSALHLSIILHTILVISVNISI